MKKFSFISHLFVIIAVLTLGSLSAWGHTFNCGTVIYIDFSQVTGGGGVNYTYNNNASLDYDASGAGTVKTITFSTDVTWSETAAFIKTQKGDWAELTLSDKKPSGSQNCALVAADGKSFTWTTRTPTIKMHGNFTGTWANTAAFTDNGTTATLTLNITSTGTKEFGMRLGRDDAWTSNGSAFTRSSTSNTIACGSGNCTLNVDKTGTYTFTWTYSTNTLTVTYPVELVTIYFVNSSDWTGTMKCHVWKDGGSAYTSWSGATMTNTGLTDDCGHAIWKYDLDNAYDRVIFNNGSNQTRDIVATDSILTLPYFDNSANRWNATPPATCSDVYFINTENWTNVYCYCWNGNKTNAAWPGVAMTQVTGTTLCGHDVYKYHLSNYTNCIFTNGTTKTRDLDIVPDGYFSFSMQRWYADAAAVTAACVSSSGAPVMTYAETDSVFTRKVTVQVGATDDTTPFEEIVYYCELATPMGETYKFYQITFHNNKPGYFDLINLIPCSEYTLTVWAIDNDGLVSEDPMAINFTTACDPLNLYLRGDMNGWATNDADWQFQYHNYEHTRFILIKDIDPNQKYRLWDNGYSVYGPQESEQQPLYTGDNDGVVVFTATGTTAYISALDEIYIVGPAVAGGADDWDLTNARKLTWDNPITATWEGNVTNGAEYKLVVRHTSKGGGDAYTWESWDYFGSGNATYNEAFTNAILTFDLLTWTWKWTNADDNLCQKTGFPPAGMTADEFSGAIKAFQMGYEISIYTPSATQLVVEAKSNDWAKKAGSVAPVFLVFTEENTKGKVLEKRMVDSGRQDANGNKIYTLTINQGDDATNYSEDLVADFTMGACLKWAVKFEFSGGFSVTDPMYYYIRQGCAPDYFEIYHHDDLPDIKGDIITQFEGGEILQPIIYYRKFNPGAWETLCLPFTCSAVRVYDPDDKQEYDLVPQHGSKKGKYLLRTFANGNAEERENFKPNWTDVPEGVELPQKDVPYIMMVPNKNNYYDDKYVMFYGKGYQTIANKSPWIKQGAPATGFYYFGNTTMWPQNLGQAYMISSDGWWFEKSSGNTLYPFECYVVADAATTARFIRMGMTESQEEQIATGLPDIGANQLQYRYDGANLYLEATANTPLAIYSVDGQLIISSSLDANIEKAFALPPGIYIVHTQVGLTKLAL